MNQRQKHYLYQCYQEYDASLSTCERCGPAREPIRKRWVDAIHSVVDYLNVLVDFLNLAEPTDPERSRVLVANKCPTSDIFAWAPGSTWGAGVFEADSYDSGVHGWYWRIPGEDIHGQGHTTHHTSDPATAIFECVNAFEKSIGADPLAPKLVFTVRIQSCESGHDWKHLYTGRHGSDKGDDFYECRVCGEKKRE